ncbi:zinc finger, CCHC-type containing protein [Tanacetum coccineum]
MGDENPIRTLGDYSNPSHEGYRNTIELPIGNNVNWLECLPAGSITTWEDLTTQFLTQFFPPGKTTKLHNDILMFQQHHGESLSEAWTRFKDLLQKFPHHGIDLWLQIQMFYNRIDDSLKRMIDFAAGGQLRRMSAKKAWVAIDELAQYEDEGWNDPEDGDIDYENPNIEQLLGVMERKVDTIMKDAISIMGTSECVFQLITNKMHRPPSEPSRQEEFEHIVMNFIFDQEERIRQLEDYMQVITKEFMEFSSKVARRLKEGIKENKNKPRKIEKIKKNPDTKIIPSPQPRMNTFRTKPGKKANQPYHYPSNSLTTQPLAQSNPTFMDNKPIKPKELEALRGKPPHLAKKQWKKRYEPLHKGVTFRLGGVKSEMSLLEFRWRVGLYSERESRNVATLSGLRGAETVNATRKRHWIKWESSWSSTRVSVVGQLPKGLLREIKVMMRKVIEKEEMRELGAL